MSRVNPTQVVRSWNPASRRGEGAIGPELLRRREVWFVAVLVLFVMLLLVWQQNRTWNLTRELATLEAEQIVLQSRVRLLGTQVTEHSQPDYILAGLPTEENPSLDLADRYMVPGDPRPDGQRRTQRYEAWLASLGITVPSALASSTR